MIVAAPRALEHQGLLARAFFDLVRGGVDTHEEPDVKVHVHTEKGHYVAFVAVCVGFDA